MSTRCGLIWKHRTKLPVTKATPIVTLLEGDTPLIAAPGISKAARLPDGCVHLKFEGLNPTGSFKDRGMTLAVSKAVEEGAKGVICASTGNTAASAAAYAARAGLRCAVLLPAGGVAAGKLAQALMHGAEVIAVKGNFDQALRLAVEAAEQEGWTLVNSSNPYRLQGQKTASFEVIEDLGRAPDFQFMPVGNAGNISAYWMGYTEAHKKKRSGLPRMFGYQAAGAAPIVLGRPVKSPKTIASAIRIGDPVSWTKAEAARDQSKGRIDKVTDQEILKAYRLLASGDGVFCEPSSATGVAGLLKFAKAGGFKRLPLAKRKKLRVVCVLTGNGLKDPDTAKKMPSKMRTIKADMTSLKRALRA